MKIIFFGTSPFAAKILKFLLDHHKNIVAVVTRTDKPQGRSLKMGMPPVKELAQQYPHIPILQPAKASTPEFAAQLQTYNADLFIVAAYGEILKQEILNIPKYGAINVHGSLLPKYRGAAPIQRCLMNGDPKTGITIIQMVLEMDAGDVLEKAEISITPEMTYGTLEEKLADISGPVLLKVLEKIQKGALHPTPQNSDEVTFSPKILPHETQIIFNLPASAVHNQIRALAPAPGAWCYVQVGSDQKRLKIKQSEIATGLQGYPGENLVFNEKEWIVGCATGALRLIEVQLEGKKSIPIQEFLRGCSEPLKILV